MISIVGTQMLCYAYLQENEELERNRNELGDLNTDILSLKDWIEQTQVQVARQAQKLVEQFIC